MAGLPLLATSLDSELSNTPSTQGFRRAVINKMWTRTLGQNEFSKKSEAYNAYFVHIYEPLCHAGSSGEFEQQIRAVTHAELLDITVRLQTGLESGLQTMQTERTIKLAAGIFLPLNFGGTRGAHRPGRVVNWGLDQSLTQLVESTFLAFCTPQQQPQIWREGESRGPHPTCLSCASIGPSTAQAPVLTMNNPIMAGTSYFPRSFSAYKLNYIAGFQVIWTSNLLDHLRLVDEDDTGIKVFIFHHAILLDLHLSLPSPVIPHALIQETKETLALLLPKRDPKVKRWFQRQQKANSLDPGVMDCGHLIPEYHSIEHFCYWKQRLQELKDAYDGHQPRNPMQVWRDDRQTVQWWTFWIATVVLILTILFGLIQCITGIIQAVMVLHPTNQN